MYVVSLVCRHIFQLRNTCNPQRWRAAFPFAPTYPRPAWRTLARHLRVFHGALATACVAALYPVAPPTHARRPTAAHSQRCSLSIGPRVAPPRTAFCRASTTTMTFPNASTHGERHPAWLSCPFVLFLHYYLRHTVCPVVDSWCVVVRCR